MEKKDVRFGEIRNCISAVDPIQLCTYEDMRYKNYLFLNEVPDDYNELYVFGIGPVEIYDFADERANIFRDEKGLVRGLEIVLAKKPRSEIEKTMKDKKIELTPIKSLDKWFIFKKKEGFFVYYTDKDGFNREKITKAKGYVDGIFISSGKEDFMLEYDKLRLHSRDFSIYYPDDLQNFCEKFSLEKEYDEILKSHEQRVIELENERALLLLRLDGELLHDTLCLILTDERDTFLLHTVYKNAFGKLSFTECAAHTGTFDDSVLINAGEGAFSVSYFPRGENCVEFYHLRLTRFLNKKIPDGTNLGIIKNAGKIPFRVKFTWGRKAKIPAGETLVVKYNVTGNE